MRSLPISNSIEQMNMIMSWICCIEVLSEKNCQKVTLVKVNIVRLVTTREDRLEQSFPVSWMQWRPQIDSVSVPCNTTAECIPSQPDDLFVGYVNCFTYTLIHTSLQSIYTQHDFNSWISRLPLSRQQIAHMSNLQVSSNSFVFRNMNRVYISDVHFQKCLNIICTL